MTNELYLRQHPIHIVHHFLIRESNQVQSMLAQNVLTFTVILLLKFMNRPINFYHQPYLMAVEIHNEPIDYMLTSKMKTIQPITTEIMPQIRL